MLNGSKVVRVAKKWLHEEPGPRRFFGNTKTSLPASPCSLSLVDATRPLYRSLRPTTLDEAPQLGEAPPHGGDKPELRHLWQTVACGSSFAWQKQEGTLSAGLAHPRANYS